MLGTMPRLREVAIRAILHRVRITVAELICHGVVAGLAAVVWFLRTFAAIRVILQVVTYALGHVRPFHVYTRRLPRNLQASNRWSILGVFVVILLIGKFNSRLTRS